MNGDNLHVSHLQQLAHAVLYQFNRIFIRHGMTVPELQRLMTWAAARAAMKEPEFSVPGRDDRHAQSAAYAAVLTGLNRSYVKRASEEKAALPEVGRRDFDRLLRVLTAWRTKPGYQEADGKPVDLPLRGRRVSLHRLCEEHAGDTTTRAIADALVMRGCAEWLDGNNHVTSSSKRLRFVQAVVAAHHSSVEAAVMLTQIGADFMHSMQQALDPNASFLPRFREGYFDDIDAGRADAARNFLNDEVNAFNKRCTEGLKKFRAPHGTKGIRMGVGSYTFCHTQHFLVDPCSYHPESNMEDSGTPPINSNGDVPV